MHVCDWCVNMLCDVLVPHPGMLSALVPIDSGPPLALNRTVNLVIGWMDYTLHCKS